MYLSKMKYFVKFKINLNFLFYLLLVWYRAFQNKVLLYSGFFFFIVVLLLWFYFFKVVGCFIIKIKTNIITLCSLLRLCWTVSLANARNCKITQ